MTRWPAEWEPHERTVMCWPTRDELWGNRRHEAEHAHAAVAAAIGRFEPVTMIATPDLAERATELCATTDGYGIDVVALPIDDSWFRDSGPIFVFDPAGDRLALDWIFNSWGEKFVPFDSDAAIARRWATDAGHPVRVLDMVLEGGSIAGNGEGTIVTTEQCLLHPNRNPQHTQSDIERQLLFELGADHLIWLPHGLALDDDTDGHVDNVAAFASPNHLVVQGCSDADEADHLRLRANRRAAERHDLSVTEVPVLPFLEIDRVRVAVPYVNYYVGNGFVVVPTCGHDADDDMIALIGEQYPDRHAFGLDVGATLAFGGGGIHCITQQVPSRLSA